MENADERANEVAWVGIGAEITARDGAFHRRNKRSVNETSRAFNEAYRAARDRIHGRDDERLGGHMINEEEHPRA